MDRGSVINNWEEGCYACLGSSLKLFDPPLIFKNIQEYTCFVSSSREGGRCLFLTRILRPTMIFEQNVVKTYCHTRGLSAFHRYVYTYTDNLRPSNNKLQSFIYSQPNNAVCCMKATHMTHQLENIKVQKFLFVSDRSFQNV